MKTLLIFPPASDPAHPPLGIAALAGFLRERGEDIHLLDLNLHSYYSLLSRENLRFCAEKIERRLKELESLGILSIDDAEEYRLLVQNSISGNFLIESIDDVLYRLKQPETYTSQFHYKKAASIVKRAMEFVSAAYFPVRWYSRGFSMSYLPTKSTDVLAAISDEDENLFIPFYESCLSQIVEMNPGITGISINYYCQLIPGLTLAAMIKKSLEETVIVLGGGLICFFEDQWQVLRSFSAIVDAFIPFEGEIPLHQLIGALKKNKNLSKIPGVLYFEGSTVKFNLPESPPDPASLPPPDYDGLPLAKYLSPEIVLPILSSRGCYWGRCAFCSHAHLYRRRFRKRAVQQVIGEMKRLSRRFDTVNFYFTDEAIIPAFSRELAEEIQKSCLPYRWFGEIRFESVLDKEMIRILADGGCCMLMFGLESGEKRILNLMNKGTEPKIASKILRMCKKAGIRTFVMFFAGFPTETLEEAEKTVKFIENHEDCINQIAFTNFVLEKCSPIYANPTKYGILEIKLYANEDLKIYASYRVTEGLTGKEAVAFLDEVKDRPKIHALIDSHLLSRSHLIFLPIEREEESREEYRGKIDLSLPESLYPEMEDGLALLTTAFNLGQIADRLENNSRKETKEPIKKCSTNYFFNPEREKLVEVKGSGLLLIQPCNGCYRLEDILASLGKQNRKTALNFYMQLYEAGFLYWEKRQ